jgi:hypothetical protein
MDVEGSTEEIAAGYLNRRATPRLAVEGPASLLLLKHGSSVPCRVIDLSLGGCRIETDRPFVVGLQARVEVSFTVHGLVFRFTGTTQWADGRHQAGIHFVDMTSRRRDELVEVLHEVEEENAARAAKQAAERQAALEQAAAGSAEADTEAQAKPTAEGSGCDGRPMRPEAVPDTPGDFKEARTPSSEERAAKPAKRERRAQARQEVDTSAVIYLVNVRSRLHGRIHDLSLGGCRIRTDERFPVGIYTRVETEFRIEGLPFRLGGVIQAVHERQQVGIRFLDLSDRKRAQVEQLIEEIREMRERERLA